MNYGNSPFFHAIFFIYRVSFPQGTVLGQYCCEIICTERSDPALMVDMEGAAVQPLDVEIHSVLKSHG